MLIGLTGRAGAGKNTAAQCIARAGGARLECQEFSFADPLKDSVCALFGITRERMEEWKRSDMPFLSSQTLSPQMFLETADFDGMALAPMTMRELLQRYGTEAHRDVFGQSFWVDQAMARYAEWYQARMYQREGWAAKPCAIFTDVRFPNEATAIQERGGKVVCILRPGMEGSADAHISEANLSQVDVIINNDGDIESLQAKLAAAVVFQGPRSGVSA